MLSVKLPNPRFNSQTKVKLVNGEVEGVVSSIVYEGLLRFFDENPDTARRGHQEHHHRRASPARPHARPVRPSARTP